MDTERQDFSLDISFISDTTGQPAASEAISTHTLDKPAIPEAMRTVPLDQSVIGTVVEIPCHNFALVNVLSIGLVMCFRASLNTTCRRLTDILKIGDTLAMRMRCGPNKEWYVLSAAIALRKPAPLLVPNKKKEVDLTPHESKPDERVPLSRCVTNRRYLLNWPGFLTIVPETGIAKVSVKHAFGCTVLEVNDPVVWTLTDNEPMDCASLIKFLNRDICFDAVWQEPYWKIEKLWLKEKCSSERLLLDKLCSHRAVIRSGTWCCGKITAIPFHDAAIALVGDLPVFLPIESLVTEDVMKSQWSTVNMFVDEGSSVAVKITQSGGGLIRAEQCLKIGVSKGESIDLESYLTKWGPSRNFTKEGVLNRKGNAMYVLIEGSCLSVRKDKIFVNGKVASQCQLYASLGEKVSCICKPGYKEVMYAWLDAFEPWVLLKNELVVPKGIVHPNKYYEAVVEAFPLPGYAICRIGVLPVLLLITEDRDHKRGDVTSLCVEEKDFDGVCCLVAKSIQACTNASLLVNFRGRVESVDTPSLSIKSDENFDVSFEWSAVKPFKTRQTDIIDYFKRVREFLKVGTNVQFSARMSAGVIRPYCAVEVFVDLDL